MSKKIEAKVQSIKQRISSSEAITRMMLQVQIEQLVKAERLRKLALAAVIGDVKQIRALREYVTQLNAFHRPARMSAAVKRFLRAGKGKA